MTRSSEMLKTMACPKAFVVMQTALAFGALFWTQQICTKFIPLHCGCTQWSAKS